MTKRDLRSTFVVKLRNDEVCVILDNTCASEGKGIFRKWCCVAYFEEYNDDLTHKTNNKYDIMKVSVSHLSGILNLELFCKDRNLDWDWERKATKELTVSEIEKLLGYPVKIVKE